MVAMGACWVVVGAESDMTADSLAGLEWGSWLALRDEGSLYLRHEQDAQPDS